MYFLIISAEDHINIYKHIFLNTKITNKLKQIKSNSKMFLHLFLQIIIYIFIFKLV